MTSGNKTLGRFKLIGIPPALRGVPQIEVTFDIDANGIVDVSAKDNATGKAHYFRITDSSGLSKAEIDHLIKDSELHADEDKKKKSLAKARNSADVRQKNNTESTGRSNQVLKKKPLMRSLRKLDSIGILG